MIRSRTAQLIYQSFYCALGLVGIFDSLGYFQNSFSQNFYLYFTNLSNYLCIGIMFAQLVQTAKRDRDGFVSTAPALKFAGILSILLTFLIFNFILANQDGRDPALNRQVESVLFHGVLPVMYIADWFLFYERRKAKWFYPLLSCLPPVAYVVFIYVRAAYLNYDSSRLLYPYSFLNPSTQGLAGVSAWLQSASAAFLLTGFMFFLLDRIFRSPREKTPDF